MKAKITIISIIAFTLIVALSCRKKALHSEESYSDSPVLPEKPYDYNKSINDNAATLGRVLFYDKSLSLNNSVACASCHQQSKAFCDNLQFSVGLENSLTPRNSPSIFARNSKMFWDGRASSLSDLVLRPIQNHVEMRIENLEQLAEKVSNISYYPELFKKAFGNSVIDSNTIRAALTEFLFNFDFSGNKFRKSELNQEHLNTSESLGRSVFFGKGRCSQCHKLNDEGGNSGAGYGTIMPSKSMFNIGLEQVYHDNGVGAVTKNTDDYGKFMIPVLLNIEFTAPYMHDGRFKTLEEVVEHYNSGVNAHPNLDIRLRDIGTLSTLTEAELMSTLDLNKNNKIDPSEMSQFPAVKLGLTSIEKKSLVDFLKTLSDYTILSEKKFSDPFKL